MDIKDLTLRQIDELRAIFGGQATDCKCDGAYVIVRTQSAGVFAGNITSRKGKEVTLKDARRLWYWSGAASLSQLAVDGTKKPADCKFPVPVPQIELTEAIEVIQTTKAGEESIKAVKIWVA